MVNANGGWQPPEFVSRDRCIKDTEEILGMLDPRPSVEEYRRYALQRVDILNHALDGIAPDRVRYHICWGSWHGPHTTDFPLRDIVDIMCSPSTKYFRDDR